LLITNNNNNNKTQIQPAECPPPVGDGERHAPWQRAYIA
jgi:hypothetical protein